MKHLLFALCFLSASVAFARPAKRPCPARVCATRPAPARPAAKRSTVARPVRAIATKSSTARKGPTGHPQRTAAVAPPVAKPAPKARPASPAVSAKAKPAVSPASPSDARKPDADDPDHDRIAQLQDQLERAIHSGILGRLRVGLRVENVLTGRVLFDHRGHVLMDPASNQKILATATALLRLGGEYRFRTEVIGSDPDADGRVAGDVVLRGSGDPSLRLKHLDELARQFVQRGVTTVLGNVLADNRRIDSDEPAAGRSPVYVANTAIEIRVHPGDRPGAKGTVSLRPHLENFVVVNQTETKDSRRRSRVGATLSIVGGKVHVAVSGFIRRGRGDVVLYRTPPGDTLYTAMIFRQALIQAGIEVKGDAGLYRQVGPSRVSRQDPMNGTLLALATAGAGTPPLYEAEGRRPSDAQLLALHESSPLSVLIRRVNKASDNAWAERVLENVGAEAIGGSASTSKGLKIVREAMAELGLPASEYQPANGSGLGHNNRVTPHFMVSLFKALYLDPRIGPELLQSLSVGGVDGTTRNRFRGTSSAERVRAKTGTLNGVSCLSGIVGDGTELLAFSILVEGHRRRSVSAVRAAQVGAVNAMMRFARGATVAAPADEGEGTGVDYETGDAETTFGEDPKPAE